MPIAKLTDLAIRKLKPSGDQREEFWDESFTGGSFGVRMSKTGRKSFVLLFRTNGRLRRMTLGIYPHLSLADARKKANQILGRVAQGEDPAQEKAGIRKSETFAELGSSYLERHAKVKKSPKSIKEDERILQTYLIPKWGQRKFITIRKKDVLVLLEKIAYKSGARGKPAPVMANRVLALASKIFNFAIEKDIAPDTFVNPCMRLKPLGKETTRERVLSDDEIRRLWKELEKHREPTASIYRLILLTAQRPGEVKQMRWDQIDEEVWTIPAEATKNKKGEHKVPLSSQALEILETLKTGESEWVFPSADGHLEWLQKMSQRLQKNCGFKFRPHDLRRTAATKMSQLGVDQMIIAKILNHAWADRHITAVYDRWHKLPEMRQALERWAAHLQQILTEEAAKVVKIR